MNRWNLIVIRGLMFGNRRQVSDSNLHALKGEDLTPTLETALAGRPRPA
jgi:hypothetical protein